MFIFAFLVDMSYQTGKVGDEEFEFAGHFQS